MAVFKNQTDGCIFNSAIIYAPATIPDSFDAFTPSDADKVAVSDSGVTISATPEIIDIPYAGSFERRNKGDQVVIKTDIKVEGEVIILNEKVLKASLLKKDATVTSTKYDVYVPVSGALVESDYINLVIVGKLKGSNTPAIAVVKNCLNYEGLSIETKDKETGKSKMVFEGAYEGDTNPYKLYLPKTTA